MIVSAHDHRSVNCIMSNPSLKFRRFPTVQKVKFGRDLLNSYKELALF